MTTPALPPGFELENPTPQLPPGFELEQPTSLSLSEAQAKGLSPQQYEQQAADYIKSKYAGGERDTALGINKAFATEAGPGFVAGALGMPGDVESLGRMGLGWLTGKDQGPNRLYTSTDVRSGIESALTPYTGGLYEPKNMAERISGTIGSFAPLAIGGPTGVVPKIANFARTAAIPGATTELAGEGAKQLDLPEGPARMAAALLSPMLARKLITPNTLTAERQAAVEALRGEGIPVTAEQAVGKGVPHGIPQYTESMMTRMGAPAGARADADTFTREFGRLATQYDDLTARNTLHGDPLMNRELQGFHGEVNTPGHYTDTARNAINHHLDRLRESVRANGGVLPGDEYQRVMSTIKKAQRAASKNIVNGDYQVAQGLSDLTHIMESGMERSIGRNNPADLGLWRDTNRQYRNGLVLEHAAKPTESNTALGYLMPNKVAASAAKVLGERSLIRNRDDFAEPTKAAMGLGLGKTGESRQGFWPALAEHHIPLAMILGGEQVGQHVGQHVGALPGAVTGALAGAGIPAMAYALKDSRLGQAYRMNQALPYQTMRQNWPLQAAMVAKALQQGVEQQKRIRITPQGTPDNGPALISR